MGCISKGNSGLLFLCRLGGEKQPKAWQLGLGRFALFCLYIHFTSQQQKHLLHSSFFFFLTSAYLTFCHFNQQPSLYANKARTCSYLCTHIHVKSYLKGILQNKQKFIHLLDSALKASYKSVCFSKRVTFNLFPILDISVLPHLIS